MRIDVDQWRRRLSAGLQDFSRFQETLLHSVGIGDLDRLADLIVVVDGGRVGEQEPKPNSWPPGVCTPSCTASRPGLTADQLVGL
ncbi:MAG: hypothetical protein ACRD1K_21270 [Acidimicrobiales bacterium]